MPNTPVYFATITELSAQIKARQLSPVDVTQALLTRIEQLDPRLKSYATVMADHALQAAQVAEQEISAGTYRGPLHGVPVAVKDLCYTRGVRTMGGTRALAEHVPSFDATVVARLRAAGAILLGKLNTTEGAMGGYHPEFNIPLNPWRADCYAGASSSGSGVATAAGLCFGSLGSDTGGSIRFPAAALWDCRAQTDLGPGEPLWRAGAGGVTRSRGPHDAEHAGRGHHAAGDRRVRST